MVNVPNNVFMYENNHLSGASPLDELIIHTKLLPPVARIEIIDRLHLLVKLGGQHPAPLTLFCAPAGFGKTTSAIGWLKHLPAKLVWYSLDEDDNSPSRFLIYIVAAIQKQIPGFAPNIAANLISSQPTNLQHNIALLINHLTQVRDDIMLALDDYHHIENPEVQQLLETLITKAPANLYFCIISRHVPALNLSRLRVSNQICEVTESDLQFNCQESAQFFRNVMHISSLSVEQIDRITQKTEGWIAGMQLAAINMKRGVNINDLIDSLSGQDKLIGDYFAEELLSGIDQKTQDFLLSTSVLSRFNAELCQQMVPGINAQEMIRNLERTGLFIQPLDTAREWFRYHHLFSSLLRYELEAQYPERCSQLYQIACEWCEQNHYHEEAFQYACKQDSFEQAITLLEKYFWPNVKKGRFQDSYHWLKAIPEDYFFLGAGRATLYAWCMYTAKGQYRDDILKKAEELLTTTDNADRKNEALGNIELLRGFNACRIRNIRDSIAYIEKALTHFSGVIEARTNIALTVLATCYHAIGNLPRAEDLYTKAAQHAMEHNIVPTFFPTLTGLSQLYLKQGKAEEAEQVIKRGFQTAISNQWDNLPNMGWLYLAKGEISLQQGALDKCIESYQQAHAASRHEMRNMVRHFVALRLAQVYQVLGDEQQTIRYYREAISEPYNPPLTPIISDFDLLHVAYLTRQNHIDEAGNLAAAWQLENADEIDILNRQKLLGVIHLMIIKRQYEQALKLLNPLIRACEKNGLAECLIRAFTLSAIFQFCVGNTIKGNQYLKSALSLGESLKIVFPFLQYSPLIWFQLHKLHEGYITNETFSIEFLTRLIAYDHRENSRISDASNINTLSTKELEVMALLTEGFSNNEISERMFVSVNTVKTHLRKIFEKLGVNNRAAAISKAIENRILVDAPEES